MLTLLGFSFCIKNPEDLHLNTQVNNIIGMMCIKERLMNLENDGKLVEKLLMLSPDELLKIPECLPCQDLPRLS